MQVDNHAVEIPSIRWRVAPAAVRAGREAVKGRVKAEAVIRVQRDAILPICPNTPLQSATSATALILLI